MPPLLDFDAASRRVLAHLSTELDLGLWMVTRTNGDDWIVLTAVDQRYGVTAGDVFAWGDSFCVHMVSGDAPRVAASAADVPAFRDAPIGRQVPIGTYIGVPIMDGDGQLFGTICGIDPDPGPADMAGSLPLVELLADMLSSILGHELAAAALAQRADRLQERAERDGLTGVLNRSGWNKVLERESARCRRYGHGAAVVVVDLDGLKQANDAEGHASGDAILVDLAEALRATSRAGDAVARLGGDEFALLAVETSPGAAEELADRLREELGTRGVAASVGAHDCRPGGDLAATWHDADLAMYEQKRARRQP
ncbi:MAG: sensor domain-containing diguanylate cyclase [Acidimicrobiales bacterium]